MKVIVIGGSGYIGRNIGLHITAEKKAYYSRNRNSDLDNASVEWIQGSVLDAEKVTQSVKDYDMVVYAAGIQDEREQKFFDIHVNGVKNVSNALKKNDTDQRLVYLSSINVHYGSTEYFRTKRTGEDNAALVKNHLNVRPSVLFGNGDAFTEKLFRLASVSPSKFPGGGSLSPVHVEDLVRVIEAAKDIRGAVDVSSRDRITFGDAINIARKKLGLNEVKLVDGRFGYSGSVDRVKEKGIFAPDEVDRYLLNLYRENTYLDRFVKSPVSFREHLENYEVRA